MEQDCTQEFPEFEEVVGWGGGGAFAARDKEACADDAAADEEPLPDPLELKEGRKWGNFW